MLLQPVRPSTQAAAEQVAAQLVNQIVQTAQRVVDIRASGIPAVAAVAEQTLPDGRVISARPAREAIPAAAIDAALGADNCAVLAGLAAALGL